MATTQHASSYGVEFVWSVRERRIMIKAASVSLGARNCWRSLEGLAGLNFHPTRKVKSCTYTCNIKSVLNLFIFFPQVLILKLTEAKNFLYWINIWNSSLCLHWCQIAGQRGWQPQHDADSSNQKVEPVATSVLAESIRDFGRLLWQKKHRSRNAGFSLKMNRKWCIFFFFYCSTRIDVNLPLKYNKCTEECHAGRWHRYRGIFHRQNTWPALSKATKNPWIPNSIT